MKPDNNHISTRVDLEVKRRGLEFAKRAERLPSWVWARAIELGLPEVLRLYQPSVKKKKAAKNGLGSQAASGV